MQNVQPTSPTNLVDLTGIDHDSGTNEHESTQINNDPNNQDNVTMATTSSHELNSRQRRLATHKRVLKFIRDNVRAEFELHDTLSIDRKMQRRTLRQTLFEEIERSVEEEEKWAAQNLLYDQHFREAEEFLQNNKAHWDYHPLIVGINGYEMPPDIQIKLRMATSEGGGHNACPNRGAEWYNRTDLNETRHYPKELENAFLLGLYSCKDSLIGKSWDTWSEVWSLIKAKQLPSARFWWKYYHHLQNNSLLDAHNNHAYHTTIGKGWHGIIRSFYYRLHRLPDDMCYEYIDETAEHMDDVTLTV